MQFEACEAFIKAHAGNGWRWIEEHFDDEDPIPKLFYTTDFKEIF